MESNIDLRVWKAAVAFAAGFLALVALVRVSEASGQAEGRRRPDAAREIERPRRARLQME